MKDDRCVVGAHIKTGDWRANANAALVP